MATCGPRHFVTLAYTRSPIPNRAHDNFEQIKGVYGAGSCYLLQVNSRAPGNPSHGTPDPWSQYSSLRVADHEVVGVVVGGANPKLKLP